MELATCLSDQANGDEKTGRFGTTGIAIVSSVVVLGQSLNSEMLHNLYVFIIDNRMICLITQSINRNWHLLIVML